MKKTKKPRFGKLPPKYRFILNPYPDLRMSRCPDCENTTAQRKLPLLIHVDPLQLIAINYTCRYCRPCDLLIAHKHELEHLLTGLFSQHRPELIGNDYLVMGTLEKKTWREGLTHPKPPAEMLPHASDFTEYCNDLRVTRPGWYHRDQEPPVWEPPASQEWVKRSTRRIDKNDR